MVDHADHRLSITVFLKVSPTITEGYGGCGQSINGAFECCLLMKYEQCNIDREGGKG